MSVWLYNKDGAKLFNDAKDAPNGYVDCPTKVQADDKPPVKNAVKEPVKVTKKAKD